MKTRRLFGCFVLTVLMVGCAACASLPKQASIGEFIDDSVITTKVKSLLVADDFLKSLQIGVETYKGAVQLSGFVGSQKDAEKAVQITTRVEGVKSIVDSLIVK
ncbi:MAG: BON domain-containing protein [Desulfobacterales bacterium]|nr:BON domain-containing protein [Desulfobacterales bacterium]